MMKKRNLKLSGWLAAAGRWSAFLMVTLALVGCAQGSAPTQPVEPAATIATEGLLPTATVPPPPTATQPPTATPEPSATATQPPTATPVPALAILADGFNAWCAPLDSGTRPSGPDAPDYARKMVVNGDNIQVPIPASFCTLSYSFNQPVQDGMTLTFFDGKNAFLKLPLQAAKDHADEVWTSVTHSYVINPPLWYIDYRLSVAGPDGKELWSKPVRFAKPLPAPCAIGGYPDPVTLYCNPFDPREIEPHPENPDYPYTTPNP